MFDSIGWYSQLLLLFFVSIVFFVLVIVFRRYWNTPPSRLRLLLTRPDGKLPDSAVEALIPVLLLEERRRCFTEITGIVLSRYPLRRFTRRKAFAEALDFLGRAAYANPGSPAMDSAMCEIVRCFLEDSDVEFLKCSYGAILSTYAAKILVFF